MKTSRRLGLAFAFMLFGVTLSDAQCVESVSPCASGVPHFVRLSGIAKNAFAAARTGVVTLRFVIYDQAQGGTALWQEVQNTQTDMEGRYDVLLGATASDGVPASLFASGEPRWLGIQVVRPGSEEEARVLLVSVPYALKAGDAQTLGGLPASAFVKATQETTTVIGTTSGTVAKPNTLAPALGDVIQQGVLDAATPRTPGANVAAGGSFNQVPRFTSTGLINSQIKDSDGMVSLQNLSNILFADRFPNGVPDAVSACPANGCIIYALSPQTNLNLGTIDPGTKAITLYLGPYTYTVNQIVLRKAFKIIGMGASGGVNGSPTCSTASPCNGTSLQSVNGNNPVFIVPQTNNTPATNVLLTGFRVLGSAGNTSEDGFLLDTSNALNTGLWYSTVDDIYMEGFKGIAIHVKGRNNDFASATQWVLFNNVVVFRAAGGGNALRLEGATFELRFRNCEFDGQGLGDGTNIYMGGLSGGVNGYPISIIFEGLISQLADTAVAIDGGFNLAFYGSHHEVLFGGYRVTNNTNIGTHGLTISDSYFAGNVGTNAGAGFELKVDTTVASGVIFSHNQMFGNPDAVIVGTNLASIVYQDNLYAGTASGPPTSGLTPQMSPAASINTFGIHTIGLNSSATPITTVQSSLGPGETMTFFTLGGSVVFGSGGNIDLMGAPSITVNGSITFVRSDLGSLQWKPISQWSPH